MIQRSRTVSRDRSQALSTKMLIVIASVQASSNHAPAPSQDAVEIDKPTEPEVSQSRPRRARARGAIVSRFKGFDDDDDVSTVPAPSFSAPFASQIDSAPRSGRSQRYSVSQIYVKLVHVGVDCSRMVLLMLMLPWR